MDSKINGDDDENGQRQNLSLLQDSTQRLFKVSRYTLQDEQFFIYMLITSLVHPCALSVLRVYTWLNNIPEGLWMFNV